jgi:hypothetical protein
MGIWTTQNGNTYSINIEENNIVMMQSYGARLCWMHDNRDILDEKSDYYEDYKENDQTLRTMKEGITVVCEDGDYITGYVTHWVRGPASGTNERNWFIIQPGKYPTYCYKKMVVEDL